MLKKIILALLPSKFNTIILFGAAYNRLHTNIADKAHEQIHIKQQHKEPIMFYFKYIFSETARFNYEAEAYATAVRYGRNISNCAYSLSSLYKLNVTVKEAKTRITYYIKKFEHKI